MSLVVTLGEIMARLATPGFQRFAQAMPGKLDVTFAGAEASIAVAIAQLGGQSAFVSALPRNPLADACLANLRGLGVDTRHVLRTEEGRLGLYFLEHGVNQRPAEVLYDREGSAMAVTPAEAYDWSAIFKGASWLVISGITPAISQRAAEVTRQAVQQAAQLGVKVALDINYRSKLWRWKPGQTPRELAMQTLRPLLPQLHLLIGGAEDVATLLEVANPGNGPEDLEALARESCRRLPNLRWLAMTRRESQGAGRQRFGGFLHDSEAGRSHFAPVRDGKPALHDLDQIVDRLGAGDAFSAALILAMQDAELDQAQRAVAFATAAGCLAHSLEGDYLLANRAEVLALMQGDNGGRVKR